MAMARSHVSNTTLTLGSTGTPATPQGKKMVWNRRKQEWIEVDDDQAQTTPGKPTPSTSNLLSSNAYASGVNQNSGNFLTEKPITRIHAPPGGASSIVFGDEISSTPSKSAPPAQIVATVATPTQPATPESSSEGTMSAQPAEDATAPIPMMELPPAPTEESEKEGEAVAPSSAPMPSAAAPAVSANAYASGTSQNSGNFMTGRPTTRVRAPPGGASSITFG